MILLGRGEVGKSSLIKTFILNNPFKMQSRTKFPSFPSIANFSNSCFNVLSLILTLNIKSSSKDSIPFLAISTYRLIISNPAKNVG